MIPLESSLINTSGTSRPPPHTTYAVTHGSPSHATHQHTHIVTHQQSPPHIIPTPSPISSHPHTSSLPHTVTQKNKCLPTAKLVPQVIKDKNKCLPVHSQNNVGLPTPF